MPKPRALRLSLREREIVLEALQAYAEIRERLYPENSLGRKDGNRARLLAKRIVASDFDEIES